MRTRDKKHRRRTAPASPDATDTRRYERLQQVLEELSETSLHAPVLVEGPRDKAALRELGVTGEIIVINTGRPIEELCRQIEQSHERVVLLMDWDSTGQALEGRLREELMGMWEEHERSARLLKLLCRKEVRDIEGIPALIRRLGRNAIARAEG